MKKYILILVCVIAAPYVWAQNVQRNGVMPGFFVPSGALKTQTATEKLPSVESMAYKNKKDYIQAQAQKAQRLEAEKQKREAAAKQEKTDLVNTANNGAQNTLNKPYTDPAAISSKKEQIKATNSFLPQTVKTKPISTISTSENEDENLYDDDEDFVNETKQESSDIVQNENKAPSRQQSAQQRTSQADSPQQIFALIFSEYEKDIKAISRGEFVENKRLNKILADYQNQEHIF